MRNLLISLLLGMGEMILPSCEKVGQDPVSSPGTPIPPSITLYYGGDSLSFSSLTGGYDDHPFFKMYGYTQDHSKALTIGLTNSGNLRSWTRYDFAPFGYLSVKDFTAKSEKTVYTGYVYFDAFLSLGVGGGAVCYGNFSAGVYDSSSKTWSINGSFENVTVR
ncbi:MAG TPA: hypothetical protein VHE34_06340 [Puia sp.]|uniref:hypothetical protein n=1 Tax=Puia sp. TaxID=2045100 RepID=UPI002C6A7373|nr:hypothetical protein [Puia sp.]HVU94823.1 hypothetical protein [Puia sp.]